MKSNSFKQLIISLLITIIIGVQTYAAETIEKTQISRANLTLLEMQYEHIEYAEVESMMNLLDEIMQREDEEAFYKWDDEYYALYCKLNTMIQVAQLKYQLNMNQAEYFEEYLYSIDLLGKMKTAYVEIFEEEEDKLSYDMTKYYELSVKRARLVDEYLAQELQVTIVVDGKEKTLVELAQDTSLTDKDFIKLYDKWYTAYNQKVGEILLELVKIDNQMAQIQGYKTYAESAYDSYSRDYTPQEIKQFISYVKEIIVDVFLSLYNDSVVSSYVLEGYTYESDDKLLEVIREGFISHKKELQEAYDYMLKYQLYDIESRENKISGGFTIYFDEWAEPYIVLNYAEPYETALTMIHEFGHYYSYYAIGNNEGGLDLDETYSQGLELLAMQYYDNIFGDSKYSKAAEIYTVENMLAAIIQGCLYDEFLQKIYQNPNITVEEMNKVYVELAKEYGIKVDERSWCMVAHNFQMPYYYISYSVSAVAALEIWTQSLEQKTGLDIYLKLVQMGDTYSFIESLKEVGLNNPLEKETINKVAEAVRKYFKKANDINTLERVA